MSVAGRQHPLQRQHGEQLPVLDTRARYVGEVEKPSGGITGAVSGL
ncbi:Uncharacterised protein [Mycobacterium tuberculosis]|nr:Uncharacterised protein [Mycobacterium tuberculosis]CFE80277.1 Uncharacterised protein [Mycobacterium tuberculosis]CFR89100.1 Uncharacterised protein [Mycobacterium tuberculosis]CKT33787.1 Uncharacterised protein [Mycobacterium tuberculosis]CKU17487.1 Uncharacterised protein [Mycobacterium tuberculosis]